MLNYIKLIFKIKESQQNKNITKKTYHVQGSRAPNKHFQSGHQPVQRELKCTPSKSKIKIRDDAIL